MNTPHGTSGRTSKGEADRVLNKTSNPNPWRTSMSRFVKSALIAILAAAAFAPAALAEKPSVARVAVAYSDLNLSHPAGVSALLKRIDAASKRVCGKEPSTASLGQMSRYLKCRAAAKDEGVRTVGIEAVTLAYEASAKRRIQTASR